MEKSTSLFARYFKRLLQVEMTTGDAGVGSGEGGFSPSNIKSSDSYAPEDGRNLFGQYKKRKPKVQRRKPKEVVKTVYLTGEGEESDDTPMCPEACCGKPVSECKCGPECPHCDCYKINNA